MVLSFISTMRWELVTAPVYRIRSDIRHSVTFCSMCHRFLLLYNWLIGWLNGCRIHCTQWIVGLQKSIYVTLHDLIFNKNFNIITHIDWFHFIFSCSFSQSILAHSKFLCVFFVCFVCVCVCVVLYISFMSFCVNTDLLLNNEEFRGSVHRRPKS